MLRRKFQNHLKLLVRHVHQASSQIGIIGVPFEEGQPKVGVAHAPDVIRKYGLIEQLANIRK